MYVLVRIVTNEKNNKLRVVIGSHRYSEDQLEQLSYFVTETSINNVELCIAFEEVVS